MPDRLDPAKTPASPDYGPYLMDVMNKPGAAPGPGGNITMRDANEKGILERGVHREMRDLEQSPMRSNHDAFKEGIYTSNSLGGY